MVNVDMLLPGIKKIQFTECSNLPFNIMARTLCDLPTYFSVITGLEELPFINGSLSHNENQTNNGKDEKSELKFKSHYLLPRKNICFVVSCVDNNKYLLGFNEFPYCKVERNNSVTETGQNCYEYKVSLTGRVALVQLS